MTNLSWSFGRSFSMSSKSILFSILEPGHLQSILMRQLSVQNTDGGSLCPLVSSTISYPSFTKSLARCSISFLWISGSPPVKQTLLQLNLSISTLTSSMLISLKSVPSTAYIESHQVHLRSQANKRTNTVGRPISTPSPCIEKKISLIFTLLFPLALIQPP